MLKPQLFAVAATLVLTLGAMSPAFAETEADMSFSGMVAMAHIDKNKDGMVSKKEFLDMMSKMWDMKAKKMKVKADMMSGEDYKQILQYLNAGS